MATRSVLILSALCVQTAVADFMANRLTHADLDDTTLGQKVFPSREELGKEEGNWLANLLSSGGATPLATTNPQANARGVRVREVKLSEPNFFDKLFSGAPKEEAGKTRRKAVPSQGYVPPQVTGVKPPSMFRSSLVRVPLVGLIAFFVGSVTTYVWSRSGAETLDYQPLLSA